MALINPRILKDTLGQLGPIPAHHLAIASRWAESVRDGSIKAQNETQLEGDFKSRILETLLGYTSFGGGQPQTVKAKVLMGAGEVEVAYQNAAAYAKDRIQMRSLSGVKNPDKPADAIINHPDVPRCC